MSARSRREPEWAERVLRERSRRGWTRRDMAREMRQVASRLGLGPLDGERMADYVKRWENGHVVAPDARHQMAIAGALGLSVRELFGAVAHPVSELSASVTRGNDDLPYYESAEDDVIGRRKFMAWLAALSAGTAVLPDSVWHTIAVVNQQPSTLSRITAADVADLQEASEMFCRWACKVGGDLSRHAMIGQLGWAVHQLDRGVPASSAAVHRQWQSASARLAGVAGFNCHDAGYEQQGRGLMALGYRLGAEADDRAIQADGLSGLAMQAVHIGRPKTGLDLARHGLELADDATPITRAMLHSLKARAYGHMGDLRTMEREVGLAEQEHARIVPDDREREPWLYYFNEAELHAATGVAWRHLAWHHPNKGGQRAVQEATARLSLAAEHNGAEFARGRTLCRLQAAGVYLRARDPDAAVAVSKGEFLGVRTSGIRSARVEVFAADLQKVARPFRNRPDVHEMVSRLSVVT